MKSTSMLEKPVEHQPAKGPAAGLSRFEVLAQLEKIATSEHFRNSKRYPALLRFIVEHTLSGRTDVLKERTLGTEVFGRPSDYDTNEDPVVRVAAGEIRKRLAQYYRTPGHEHELSIDIPLGSYVPHFLPASPVPSAKGPEHPKEEAAHHLEPGNALAGLGTSVAEGEALPAYPASSRFLWRIRKAGAFSLILILSSLLIAAGFFGGRYSRQKPVREEGIAALWNPILSSENPALIVIGVHSLDPSGKDLSPSTYAGSPLKVQQSILASEIYYDMVPVSDVASYGQLIGLLTRHVHPYRTQGASQTTFGQLQGGPVILVGGLDNIWTIRLTSALRYRFGPRSDQVNEIVDSAHPATMWQLDNFQSAISNSRDYAIVASFFNPEIGQHVIIAAGISKEGTAAATEFLSRNDYLKSWLTQTGPAKNKNNVEIVLSTDIVEGEQGPPQVVATYRW